MYQIPIERQVRSSGLLADDIYLQRDGDHEPNHADREETHEARPVGVVVGEQCCEVAAVTVQADKDESFETLADEHETVADSNMDLPA